jgi:hypothetical protein
MQAHCCQLGEMSAQLKRIIGTLERLWRTSLAATEDMDLSMRAVVTADCVIAVSGCCSQDHEQCSPKEYAELGEHMVVGDAEGADQQDHIGTRQADSSLQEHEAE